MHDSDIAALEALYEELGTYKAVAEYLQPHSDEPLYASLIYRHLRDGVTIYRIPVALERAGLLRPRPKVVEVEACFDCGEVHTFHSTCPDKKKKDRRKTRAWHGSRTEAQRLDEKLNTLGFPNLQALCDHLIMPSIAYDAIGDLVFDDQIQNEDGSITFVNARLVEWASASSE